MTDGTPTPAPVATGPRRRIAASDSDRQTVVAPSEGVLLGGRYLLQQELGRGGMGIVFRAQDQELNIAVAVKVLPLELAHSKRAIEDLKREAVLAMRLRHPGIVALYHFAADEDVKYLVMELLEGCSVEDRLAEKGTLPLEQVQQMARELGAALDYAHGEKIVHRDLKPSNVFLARSGDAERVRLMDFGIARQMKDSLSRLSKVDSSGTLLYMSPEQFQGKAVDARSDVYSFAATLYECLCGHPPFHSGSVSYQIVNTPPEPIPGLPDGVNQALLQGLAKRPEDRVPTAGALASAVCGERVLGPGPAATARTTEPGPRPAPEPAAGTNTQPTAPPVAPPPPPVAKLPPPAAHRSFFWRTVIPLAVVGFFVTVVLGGAGFTAWWFLSDSDSGDEPLDVPPGLDSTKDPTSGWAPTYPTGKGPPTGQYEPPPEEEPTPEEEPEPEPPPPPRNVKGASSGMSDVGVTINVMINPFALVAGAGLVLTPADGGGPSVTLAPPRMNPLGPGPTQFQGHAVLAPGRYNVQGAVRVQVGGMIRDVPFTFAPVTVTPGYCVLQPFIMMVQ